MSATILKLPPPKKGRKRRAVFGIRTMGRVCLSVMQRDGEPVPANVVCIDQPDGPIQGQMEKTEAAMLALSLFAVLSKPQQKRVRDAIGFYARNGDATAQGIANTIG